MVNRPSEEFIDTVKEVLEHLYDVPFLQHHALAQRIVDHNEKSSPEMAAQQLRKELIQAIQALSPGAEVSFRSPHARMHSLLQMHYVEGMTIQQAAHELSLSTRQAYRDLRRGQTGVAEILWAKFRQNRKMASIQSEFEQLETKFEPTHLGELLHLAKQAVERLAYTFEVTLDISLPQEPVVISTSRAMARQVLVNLLSSAVQQSVPEQISVRLEPTSRTQITLSIQFELMESHEFEGIDEVVLQLVERLGWHIEYEVLPDRTCIIEVHIQTDRSQLLVIDDNQGLIDLVERYLDNDLVRVISATSGGEGLELAASLKPDAILLDVMMPVMDGWEFLQRLRASPDIGYIPVIICSVINDPELAYSLGASAYIGKPVSQDDLRSTLKQLRIL